MKDLKWGGKIYIILVYDISTIGDGSKIWKKVYGICKRYLTHVQKSVFEGELTEVQQKRLENEIKMVIRNDLDSIIIFKNKNQKWLSKELWGIQEDKTSQFL